MNTKILNKKIPALYGLGGLFLGLIALTVIVQNQVIFKGNASPSEAPQNIQITNITDASFTVTYTTQDKVTGGLSYGIDQALGQSALDERDTPPSTVTMHNVHSIAVKSLHPATTYYFSITSGTNTYLNNGSEYQVKTGSTISVNPSLVKPLTGKVNMTSGDPADDIIIYASTSGQILSTVVKNGVFVLPINTMRTSTLDQYTDLELQTSTLNLTAVGYNASSNVQFTLTDDDVVPTITLSQNFDFSSNPSPEISQATISGLPQTLAQPTAGPNAMPAITNIKDHEKIIDAKPEFNGTAPPNTEVTIEIHSDQVITSSVKTNDKGQWSFRVPNTLAPGLHTITISILDAQGILQKITQSFTVYAEGTQVDQSATPSATIVPTATATPIPSPIVTITPATSVMPVSISPTIAITVTSSATGSASPLPTQPKIPTTGPETLPLIALVGGILFIIGISIYYSVESIL